MEEDLREKMAELADKRKHLRYQSRSVKDDEKLSEIKVEISNLTKQIGELRKEVGLCDGIAARSGAMKEKLETVQQENSVDEKNVHMEKEGTIHEHIRRSR